MVFVMEIRQFEMVMTVWYILFFAVLCFCIINAVLSAKRQNKRFILSFALEMVTIVGNLFFMYIIDHGYIDYGNNKFSGLSSMGDWIGFGILIVITGIPLVITVICSIRYTVKRGKIKQ